MSFIEVEKKIEKQWKDDQTFKKQLDKNKYGEKYIFYDGPPFATGLPHYGHLVASTIKDIVPRYWAMRGYDVPRKWGWDCIAEGTLVNLSDGTSVSIEKFDFLANVETYDINTRKFYFQNKKMFFNKGKKDCVILEFSNGESLTCTNDHQILTARGWKKAGVLDEKDEIITGNINPSLNVVEKHWEQYVERVCLSVNNFILARKSAAFCRIFGYMLSRGNNFETELDALQFSNDINLVFRETPSVFCTDKCVVNLSPNLKFLENHKFIDKFFLQDITPNCLKNELLAGLLSGFKGYDGSLIWEGKKFFDEIIYFFTVLGVNVKIEGDKIYLDDKDNFYRKIGFRYINRNLERKNVHLVSRKECGVKNVYDISVNESHNFLANGIVVHNCHGLPIEFEIEKKLGIKTKSEILKLGINKYNDACKSIVMKYSKDWKKTIDRLGRWVDMENDYKTMDLSYMNTVWNVFGQLWEKDLVYQGVKVMPYSNSCNTPLSNFEAKLNYKKIQDPSIVIKFLKKDSEIPTYFLVWTTTPWTLPSNLALCVNPELDYVVCEKDDSFYILLEKFMDK